MEEWIPDREVTVSAIDWEEKENESMLWSGDFFSPEHIGWPSLRPADG